MTSFNQKKTAEAAAFLLSLHRENRMHLIKVMKLLYIAERTAIQKWGRSITNDSFVSMKNGPVLSATLDLMQGATRDSGNWDALISDRADHKISLINPDFRVQKLSRAEMQLLKEVFNQYAHINRWKLCDLTHEYLEWKDPGSSALPIQMRDILGAGDWSDDDIEDVLEEQEAAAIAASIFA